MKTNGRKITNAKLACTIIKYGCSILIALFASSNLNINIFWYSAIELILVFLISNKFISYRFGWIVNDILILLYNIQMLVMIFANSFVTLTMLTNVDSIKALSGNAALYLLSISLTILLCALPTTQISLPGNWNMSSLSIVLALELILTMNMGNRYSPFYAYLNLIIQQGEKFVLKSTLDVSEENGHLFYREEVMGYITKPMNLPEQPNVIVIFTEGLSQNIIDDSREIMPNVKKYQEQSVNFSNYYNHTFATYRGIIGQLYSGYHENNYDSNQLVSIQQLFSNYGYHTSFINSEPNNRSFTSYLHNLCFDEVVGEVGHSYQGEADALSDKEAYDLLFEKAREYNSSKMPFFITMYTFGTHATFNSVNEIYKDGTNALLNKFYDSDYQFGTFMDKLTEEGILENTVIVYTADHCTYQDAIYSDTFPEYSRFSTELDIIPFFIYYPGITPQEIDAYGRNSLDFSPTLCDYLDITGENFFLGVSMFSDVENNTNYDTIFSDSTTALSTRNAVISELTEAESRIFLDGLYNYFEISK